MLDLKNTSGKNLEETRLRFVKGIPPQILDHFVKKIPQQIQDPNTVERNNHTKVCRRSITIDRTHYPSQNYLLTN